MATGTVGSRRAAAEPGIGAQVTGVPLTREDHRVVVIGSGFGGGVTALRLGQAGVPVTVLERGMRWPTGPNSTTFPTVTNPDKRLLWHQSAPELFGRPFVVEPYTGLTEAVVGENMTALCAAGVGGGSLVYQGMTLQPTEANFAHQFPGGIDYDEMDAVYYRRVAQMLRLEYAPDELVASPNYAAPRAFAQNLRRAGLPVSKIPMPIDWSYALAELRGEMTPAYTNGQGAFGVNNGGKNTVDVTYLAQAEATGNVTVAPLHQVTDVERAPDGKWRVYVDRIDTSGAILENKILTTDALVMAAGTMNTTKLLMRAAGSGRIPDMPDGLGAGWGSNADRIYMWSSTEHNFGPAQGGPVVYGTELWDDPATAHTVIQASLPQILYGSLAPFTPTNTTILVGYGVSDARGHFTYDAATDTSMLRWPREGDAFIQQNYIDPTVRKVLAPGDGLFDTNAVFPSTWHPLGGACIGSVCDLDGRVHGQRGLYVLDGALMPGNTAACNPSMTIAAVAERALDRIVRSDVGSII